LQVRINGETRDLADRSTLSDLIDELSLAPQRIAIEVNQQIVRRDEWPQTVLNDGDRIEIVHFVGGGATGCRLQTAGDRIFG
jgi:thiamine biosynthesis protein ThiS